MKAVKELGRMLGAYLKQTFPPNRVVLILTPIVLVPAAAAATGWLATNFPGLPPLDPTQVTVLMGGAVAAVIGLTYKWLSNWGQYEARRAEGRELSELPEARYYEGSAS